jgi:hypothetical protein
MKTVTMATLTIASVAGLAGMASALPFGVNNLPQGREFGSTITGLAQGGGGGSIVGQTAQTFGPSIVSQNSPSTPVSVPEAGTSLLLLGTGFVMLALWRRGMRRSWQLN